MLFVQQFSKRKLETPNFCYFPMFLVFFYSFDHVKMIIFQLLVIVKDHPHLIQMVENFDLREAFGSLKERSFSVIKPYSLL